MRRNTPFLLYYNSQAKACGIWKQCLKLNKHTLKILPYTVLYKGENAITGLNLGSNFIFSFEYMRKNGSCGPTF